jgi:hypothetical protein
MFPLDWAGQTERKPAYFVIIVLKICMAPGPSTTMKIEGKMKNISGKRSLTGRLAAVSRARILRRDLIISPCARSTLVMGHARPQFLGLVDRGHEPADLGDIASGCEVPQGIDPRLAHRHLLQDSAELFRKRPRRLVHDLRDRAVEAEAGLDADIQKVDRVRQRALDLVLPAGNCLAEPPLWRIEARECEAEDKRDLLHQLQGCRHSDTYPRQERRESDQHYAREASLGGQRCNLSLDLDPPP